MRHGSSPRSGWQPSSLVALLAGGAHLRLQLHNYPHVKGCKSPHPTLPPATHPPAPRPLPAAMAARHERARQQESSRREILGYVAQQRTMEAQARHQVSPKTTQQHAVQGNGRAV